MPTKLRYLGLDVHAEMICAGSPGRTGSWRELGTMRNRREALRKLRGKLGNLSRSRCVRKFN